MATRQHGTAAIELLQTEAKHLNYLPRYRNIPFFVAGGKLLELGCGTGVYLRRMQQIGWDTVGIEPGTSAREQTKGRGISAVYSSLEEAHFSNDTFDAIVSWQVVEHLHDPATVFKELLRMIKPGGQLFNQARLTSTHRKPGF